MLAFETNRTLSIWEGQLLPMVCATNRWVTLATRITLATSTANGHPLRLLLHKVTAGLLSPVLQGRLHNELYYINLMVDLSNYHNAFLNLSFIIFSKFKALKAKSINLFQYSNTFSYFSIIILSKCKTLNDETNIYKILPHYVLKVIINQVLLISEKKFGSILWRIHVTYHVPYDVCPTDSYRVSYMQVHVYPTGVP